MKLIVARLLTALLLWSALGHGAVRRAQSPASRPTPQPTPGSQAATQEAAVVLIRETDYFGVAPAYTLMIYPDGDVAFIGTKNVKVTGLVRGKMPPQDVRQLLGEARRINFSSFLDEYGPGKGCPFYLADAGSAYVSILIDGKRKSVQHDLGCSEPDGLGVFPKELYALANMIDQAANSGRWVK